jgi:deoxyribodipyrimidine photo-lyase
VRTLVWFRGKDLRVADHAPLTDAARAGEVIPLFVIDPYFFAPERARTFPHRIQFLLESLVELEASVARLGSRLVVVAGKSVDLVPALAKELAVDRVVGFRWSEPVGRERDGRIAHALGDVPFELYEGETLAEPGQLLTGAGKPFSVFTPFARAFAKTVEVGAPRRAPRTLPSFPKLPRAVRDRQVSIPTLGDLGIEPNPSIVRGGEAAARARLRDFLRGPAARYDVLRDRMGEAGTSRLSQDLKFGTLSARAVWTAAAEALGERSKAGHAYANELVWREFAYDVLRHHPNVLRDPFQAAWRAFPWRNDDAGWAAWVEGKTGYPIVDASARQLLREGFVHNRARMISASFLAKHLMIDFRRGEEHYLRLLTDGDWAANDLGWQWSAGCGVDAQPWFRVFNPTLQGQKFDAAGAYVRKWVPELAALSDKWIHRPWEAPSAELARAGVTLGKTYPRPIVDHAEARARFLAAGEALRRGQARS